MSEKQDISQPDQTLAFDYVIGALRGDERKKFERAMLDDRKLREDVAFWEEQLASLNPKEIRQPSADVWEKIAAATGGEKTSRARGAADEKPASFWRFSWLQWAAPTAAALGLMFVLIGYYPKTPDSKPNADYIAVLTDDSGRAIVSALTVQQGKTMWLKWEADASFSPQTSRQLWAISKRDGQARPIEVLDDRNTLEIPLDTAAWRLVTDAQFLILTEEEPGGSAIDEPSDVILAKGVCVRFSPDQKAI